MALRPAVAVVLAVLLAVSCGREPTKPLDRPDGALGFISGHRSSFEAVIFTIELNGTRLRLLGPGGAPVLSPARDWIAYDIGGVSDHAIWVMKVDGSAQKRLVGNTTLVARGPTWSPDGRQIAYWAYPKSIDADSIGLSEIYVMNADGSSQTKLTSNRRGNRTPAWSPDGQKIAFACFYDSTQVVDGEIYVMKVDGSGLTQLTSPYSPNINPAYALPKWSPDGRLIVCSRNDLGVTHLYVMNADGSGLRQLTDIEPNGAARWAPDGGKVVFVSRDGKVEIVNTDGTELKTLGAGGAPAWSPDGRMIAYIANAGLVVMNGDGSGPFNVHQPAGSPYYTDGAPFWLR